MSVAVDPVKFTAAVVTLLKGINGLAVFDGEIPAGLVLDADTSGRVAPYAIVYGDPGQTARSSLDGPSTLGLWSFQVTAAAGARPSASWAARKVIDALVDTVLDVPGWQLAPIGQEPGPRLTRDDDTHPARFYTPLQFTTSSTTA